MALFEWSNKYSVGVAEIDKQHKVLVDLINQLHDAMMQRKTKEDMGKILQGLLDYTIKHFGHEEKFFDKYSYPERVAHKKIHTEFIAKISEFNDDFKSGKSTVSLKLLSFLKDWLVNHIQGTDPKYVPFFSDKGVDFTERI
jgi:hemerythrin-like metal-binding protein